MAGAAHLAVALHGVRIADVEAGARMEDRRKSVAPAARSLTSRLPPNGPGRPGALNAGNVHPRLPHGRGLRRDRHHPHERREGDPDAVGEQRHLDAIHLAGPDEVADRFHVHRFVRPVTSRDSREKNTPLVAAVLLMP